MASSASVLLVDDDPFAREYVRDLLDKVGIRSVREAANGHEARKLIESADTDLVFLDVNMTPGNGLEFLKDLRMGRTSAPRNLPVIMMTVNGDAPVIGTALALDCNAYLRKPASAKEIADTMLHAFGHRVPARPVLAYDVVRIPKLESLPFEGTTRNSETSAESPQTRPGDAASPPSESSLPPERKGWFRNLFGRKTPDATEPSLTRHKLRENRYTKIANGTAFQNDLRPKTVNAVGAGQGTETTLAPQFLVAGDVLAQDVYSSVGVLLLKAGTRLNGIYIERLMNRNHNPDLAAVKVCRTS